MLQIFLDDILAWVLNRQFTFWFNFNDCSQRLVLKCSFLKKQGNHGPLMFSLIVVSYNSRIPGPISMPSEVNASEVRCNQTSKNFQFGWMEPLVSLLSSLMISYQVVRHLGLQKSKNWRIMASISLIFVMAAIQDGQQHVRHEPNFMVFSLGWKSLCCIGKSWGSFLWFSEMPATQQGWQQVSVTGWLKLNGVWFWLQRSHGSVFFFVIFGNGCHLIWLTTYSSWRLT